MCLTQVDLLHWLSVMRRSRIGCLNSCTTTDELARFALFRFQVSTWYSQEILDATKDQSRMVDSIDLNAKKSSTHLPRHTFGKVIDIELHVHLVTTSSAKMSGK